MVLTHDRVHDLIADAFSVAIGIEPPGPDDDLLALGCSSSSAMQAIGRLRRHGILLEAAQFFAAPTVRALVVGARTDLVVDVTDEERLGRGRLVPLNGHRTGPVVAFLHAAFGEPAVMRSLDVSGIDYRALGVRALGVDEDEVPLLSIEDMATTYLKALMAETAQLPTALCGYSLGGNVAYEMARQIVEAGGRVDRLILIDSVFDSSSRPGTPKVLHDLDHWRLRRRDVLAQEHAERTGAEAPDTPPDLRALHTALAAEGTMDVSADFGQFVRYQDVWAANMYAISRYVAPPSTVRTTYLQGVAGRGAPRQREQWQRLLGQAIEFVDIDADHDQIIRHPEVSTHVEKLLMR